MIHLVIGGSGSGKSEYAENLLEDSPGKYYIATMQVYDAEGRKKLRVIRDFGREKDFKRSNRQGIYIRRQRLL